MQLFGAPCIGLSIANPQIEECYARMLCTLLLRLNTSKVGAPILDT